MPRLVRCLQLAAYGSQCLAYAANDGQKMFAVVAVAFAGTRSCRGHGRQAT